MTTSQSFRRHIRLKFKIWLSALDVLIKSIGPVVAAVWIGYQYHISVSDKRIEASLEYAKRYESDDSFIGKAQRAIIEASWQHEPELKEFAETVATKEQISMVRKILTYRIIDTANQKISSTVLTSSVDELDGFFNELATCVESSLCDEETAIRFFGCLTIRLSDLLLPVFEDRRSLSPEMGRGIQWIAKKTGEYVTCTEQN
jgi:hypothetical protein